MLTKENLTAWASQAGHTVSGEDWALECPRCHHHKKRFYIHPESLKHYCFHCHLGRGSDQWSGVVTESQGEVGSFVPTPMTLDYLEASRHALFKTEEGRRFGLRYLTLERGLDLPTIQAFKLGYDPEKFAVVLPSFWRGRLVCLKYRALAPEAEPRYYRSKGGDTVLYQRPGQHLEGKACIITEGEFDAMTASQLAGNIPVFGFPGKDIDPDHYQAEFKPFESVYVIFDNEPKAQQSAELLASKLGDFRCYAVQLPPEIKDLNEWLVAQRKKTPHQDQITAAWCDLLNEAKPMGRPLIRGTADQIERAVDWYTNRAGSGASTGHAALDRITGGLQGGRVYCLTAPTKVGKTSLALDIMVNLAQAGHKCLIGSFEMKVDEEMTPKIVSKLLGRNVESSPKLTAEKYREMVTWIDQNLPLKWINRHDRVKLREIYEAVRTHYSQGFRFLLLDHLQFIMDFGHEDVFTATAKVSRLIKRLTNDFPELCILAIAQMAGNEQLGTSRFKVDTRRTMGGNQIPSDMDQLWWYGPPHAQDGCLKVTAARNTTVKAGGEVRILFDQDRAQYSILEA